MRAEKPAKPYKTFPLTAHPAGTWCKKIKGKLYHFGGWSDPDAAMAKYEQQKHALHSGREPEPVPTIGQLTMKRLCDEFMESKDKQYDMGRMSITTWRDHLDICERLLGITGKTEIVDNLKPSDFDKLAAKLAKGTYKDVVGKITQRNRIRSARAVFLFAYEQGLIDEPLKLGKLFTPPEKGLLRAEKHAIGRRDFTAPELRAIFDKADVQMKAMILLGINCGFGNNDIASLPLSAIDFRNSWIDFPRPKTAILRRCYLWPETVAALNDAIANGYEPHDPKDARLVFITEWGNPYIRISDRGSWMDLVSDHFFRAMKLAGVDKTKRGFYSLRRTFETVAGDCLDQIAVNRVMGHAPPAHDAMPDNYRQAIPDQRLKAVAMFVRKWLFPKKPTKKAAKPKKAR